MTNFQTQTVLEIVIAKSQITIGMTNPQGLDTFELRDLTEKGIRLKKLSHKTGKVIFDKLAELGAKVILSTETGLIIGFNTK